MEIAMKRNSFGRTLLIASILLLLGACKANISRNDDGSFDVETTVSQQSFQDVITASIADPLIKEITVSLQTGYVLVSGEQARLNDDTRTDKLEFRLDLAATNGPP